MKLKRYVQRMGSKNGIAFELLDVIVGKTYNHKNLIFVDLFGGGGAMSSNATYFFKSVIYNELEKEVHDLFLAVQSDEFIRKLKERWVSREEFIEIRDKEHKTPEENMILTTWSFGNNREGYIYGKDIEKRKELTHKIINSKTEVEYKEYIKKYNEGKVAHFEKYGAIWECFLYDNDFEDFIISKDKRSFKFGASGSSLRYYRKFYQGFNIKELVEHRGEMQNSKDIQLVKDIKKVDNDLQSLQRLQRLESLESLESYNKDYREVILPSPDECIIYLDPPYRDTQGYETEFNFNEFDEYVLSLNNKGYNIFISEYSLPYGEVIFEKTKRGFVSQTKDNHSGKEKLFFLKNKENTKYLQLF